MILKQTRVSILIKQGVALTMNQDKNATSESAEKASEITSSMPKEIVKDELSGTGHRPVEEMQSTPSLEAICDHSEYQLGCENCLTKKNVLNEAIYTANHKYVWKMGTPIGNAGNYATMGDLDEEEHDRWKRGYMKLHKDLLIKHFGHRIFMFLRQGFFYRLFCPVEPINCRERFLRDSVLSYSNKPLRVPGWLDCALRVLFIMDLRQHGIFRVNSTLDNVKAVQAIINDVIEGRLEEHRGMETLKTNFDTIDIAETYKQMLRSFNTTVISNKYFSTIKAIQKIEDENEKIVCTKAFLYSLPVINRSILESNARLVHILVAKMTHESNNKQMNLEGMSKVMMPCLMLKSGDNIEFEDVLAFAEFIHFLLKNFTTLIRI